MYSVRGVLIVNLGFDNLCYLLCSNFLHLRLSAVTQSLIISDVIFLWFVLGMAGTVYFLADLLEPKVSKFPAFEI